MLNQSSSTAQNIASTTIHRKLLFIILICMSTSGLVGSDLYLPTLPSIGNEFNKSISSMQLTLGIYLFGLSIGQLCFGPLTDRFGRKKPIIWGMLLYLISSLSCAFSLCYEQMFISRFFQAIGACSGLIIGRAIVGDIFNAQESGKIFATIFPFVGMSPAISPLIGGYLGFYFGWKSTFIFIGIFAFLILFLVIFYLPETLPPFKRQPLHLVKITTTYPKLLINRRFIAYVSAPCFAYVAYFGYITQSPFIFYQFGFDEKSIGTFYITLSLTYVIGNLTGKYLLNYFELKQVLKFGYWIYIIGGISLFLSGILELPLFVMIFAISILTTGNGFLIPLGTAGAISSASNSLGYASGLLGFLQLGSAALSSSFVGILSNNSIIGLGKYIVLVTFLGTICFLFLIKSENKN